MTPAASAEVGGQQVAVVAEQLSEQERDDIWPKLVEAVPRFAGYRTKTDRAMPVLRLVRQK